MNKGAFIVSREIFNNPIWQDVQSFRIFFYILGQAVFSDEGVRKGNVHIKKGQYLRSFRNLQSDLEYIENRRIKQYSISTISRKVNSLVSQGRLKIEDTELGTLFTVVNYESYQLLSNYKGTELGTALEQSGNGVGTEQEQNRNNNKNVKNEKNDKEVYTSKIKDLLSHFSTIENFNSLSKKYWDVIRETRTHGKIKESVIYRNMDKWTKYDSDVVEYALKEHIKNHRGKKEEYTIGIMRGAENEGIPTNKENNNEWGDF